LITRYAEHYGEFYDTITLLLDNFIKSRAVIILHKVGACTKCIINKSFCESDCN